MRPSFLSARRDPAWVPYAAGAGIGALTWVSLLTLKKPLGITTAYEDSAALASRRVAASFTGVNKYLAAREDVAKLSFEIPLNLGVFLGSRLLFRPAGKPWRASPQSLAGAFIGGVLVMFGARMAKGCTSGHAISGTLQLAASSWLFAPIMMATGMITARLLARSSR